MLGLVEIFSLLISYLPLCDIFPRGRHTSAYAIEYHLEFSTTKDGITKRIRRNGIRRGSKRLRAPGTASTSWQPIRIQRIALPVLDPTRHLGCLAAQKEASPGFISAPVRRQHSCLAKSVDFHQQFQTTFTFLCFEYSSRFVPPAKRFFSHTKFCAEKDFPLNDAQLYIALALSVRDRRDRAVLFR